jgi:hypothetical protein
MMNRTDQSNQHVLEQLIAAEEKESLAAFRASDFEAKVRKKVQDVSGRKGHPSPRRAAPAAAWVRAAAVMLAGAVILLTLAKKEPGPTMTQMITDILSQTQPNRILADHAPAETAPQSEAASPMERRILAALRAGAQGPEAERLSGRSARPASIKPGSGSLSLEETYKILIIDKAVERFLSLISS